MAFSVQYKRSVAKDLKNLDKADAGRVLDKVERELKKNPDAGELLKGKFSGLLGLRVGDYRVIYTRTKNGVLILLVSHRRDAYQKLERSGS